MNASLSPFSNMIQSMWSRKLIDLTGVRFGRLRVIGLADVKRYNKPAWFCRCDCGREDPKLRVLAQ
jgi:hypothetical protein